MKHFYFFIITLFFITATTAQTQISHFVSENSNTKNIVKNVDGKNYLLAFYQNDELGISEIVSQDSIIQLHTRKFQGIYENNYIEIYGKHLVFESFSGLIIYNFIDDTYAEKIFDYPVNYIYTKSPSDNDFLIRVFVKDTSLSYYYIMDFEGNITDTINSEHIYERNGDNLLIRDYEYENKKHTYIYQNFKTNITDTLFSVFDTYSLLCLGDDKMWYQDDENQLVEYDYASGNKTFFQDVVSHSGRYHYVFKSADKIYLYNYDFNDKITHIQIFDISTKTKINEVNISDIDRIYRQQFYVYNDKIVLATQEDTLIIIDPATKKHTSYDMYDTPDRLNIVEGGKIFILSWLFNYGKIFEYIDIETQTMDTIYGNHRIISRRQDFVKSGNNFIGSFYENLSGNSIFVFDMDSKIYYPAKKLDLTNTGFEYGSKIVEISDKIMVLADNLYEVNNDTLKKINTTEIVTPAYGKYSVQNDKVYYQQNDGGFPDGYINLYSYDGQELKKEMRVKISWDILNIKRYFDLGDFIYFSSLDVLYRYDKQDSSIVKVDQLRTVLFDERSLIYKNGIVYYINQGLKMIKNNEEPVTLITSMSYRNYLLSFKDRLFWADNSGFYEIKGENLETIHLNNTHKSPGIMIDKAQKNLIYTEYKNGIFHYDGSSFNKIPDSENMYGSSPAIGESFILKERKDSKDYYYFYDCTTGDVTELPSEQIEDRYLYAFVSNGDSILISKYWGNPKDVLHIYKTTDKFSNLELIDEIYDVGKGISTRFESFGNEGMLYTGDVIYLMDENLKFHPLSDLKGDYKHPEIIKRGGDLYFLAIDKTTGRQLYKTTLYSYRINQAKNFHKEYLHIFPNPAKDIIYLKNYDIQKKTTYKISGIDGKKLIQKELTTQGIDISGLNEGVYILSITTGQSVISGKFIKY